MALNITPIKLNLEETLTKYGHLIIKEINNQLAKNGIKQTNNITFNIKEENSLISLEISVPDYINYINSGRKAGTMPPLDQIVEWVISKNIQPLKKNGGIPRKTKTSLFDKQKRTAFAIAQGIKQKGIKAKKIIQPSIDKAIKGIEADLPNDISEPIEKIIKQGLIDAFAGSANVKIT